MIIFLFMHLAQDLLPRAEAQALSDSSISHASPFQLEHSYTHWLYSGRIRDSFLIQCYLPNPLTLPVDSLPVLFVLDGDMSFGMVYDIVRWLRWGNEIPEVAIIGLAYGKGQSAWWQKRSRDYTPSPDQSKIWGYWPMAGGSEFFKQFLEDELFPHLKEVYGLEGRNRIFIGMSFAGLIGADILFSQPQLFDKYILAGPALIWNNKEIYKKEKEFAGNSFSLEKVVFTAIGTLDEKNITEPWYEFFNLLKSRNYRGLDLYTWVVEGETHLSMFPAALVRGLKTVLNKQD